MIDQLEKPELSTHSFLAVTPLIYDVRVQKMAEQQTGINDQLCQQVNKLMGVIEILKDELLQLRKQVAADNT